MSCNCGDLDQQSLSLQGRMLCISNGNCIDISSLFDTDDQTISLAGNILTIEDGNSVDLTPFLDNTDDQVISASVVGSDLVLSIEDGNTVNVPLASLGSDDQLLSLVGTTLTIEDGNSVDLSVFLDNTDNQTLTTTTAPDGSTDSVTISGGNTIPIVHPPSTPPTLNKTFGNVFDNYFRASINANGGFASQHGVVTATAATVTGGSGNNNGPGNRYTVTFPAHPQGTNYTVSITPVGLLGGGVPNGLIPHIITKTATSVTYAFNSGDDGQGVDEFDRFNHEIVITGEVKQVLLDVTLV